MESYQNTHDESCIVKKLEQLTAHSNSFTGTIPPSLSNCPSIRELSLKNNCLNGSINLNCTAMVRLRSLDLGSNNFIGPFPDNLSSCQALRAMSLGRNNLNSQIPESFKNMQSLSYLSLTRTGLCNISSALSILQHCRNLTTIVFPGNFNNEVMPVDLNVQFENLTALVIANCGLTGFMPRWLQNSSKLQLLDLSWNRFSGTIPDWFGSMKFLFYLDLSNNALLPVSLPARERISPFLRPVFRGFGLGKGFDPLSFRRERISFHSLFTPLQPNNRWTDI